MNDDFVKELVELVRNSVDSNAKLIAALNSYEQKNNTDHGKVKYLVKEVKNVVDSLKDISTENKNNILKTLEEILESRELLVNESEGSLKDHFKKLDEKLEKNNKNLEKVIKLFWWAIGIATLAQPTINQILNYLKGLNK